jgi:hypothetical protein
MFFFLVYISEPEAKFGKDESLLKCDAVSEDEELPSAAPVGQPRTSH